jgi:hypothetical protein
MTRQVGIHVLPEHFQSQGVNAVLDNLQSRANPTSITTQPYVMAPFNGRGAEIEPPQDAGSGKIRTLSRPLWGKRTVSVRAAPSFLADRKYYSETGYAPPEATSLTHREGTIVEEFINEAKRRGLKVYFQIQAACPPGIRVQFGNVAAQDLQRLPDGSTIEGRVDKNGMLSSPDIVSYGCALIRNLSAIYPQIDGFRIDWPEVPPYTIESAFFGFGAHDRALAEKLGLDFERMQSQTSKLADLEFDVIASVLGAPTSDFSDWPAFVRDNFPGFADLRTLRRAAIGNLLSRYCNAAAASCGNAKEIIPQLFPPPFNLLSGIDYSEIAKLCPEIDVKLYTMHWPMIASNYVHSINRANPDVPISDIIDLVYSFIGIADAPFPVEPKLIRYPAPDEPHPVSLSRQAEKIVDVQRVAGETPVHALTHGYGPVNDFKSRLEAGWSSAGGNIHINRYAYLEDEKLDVIGEVTHS